MKFDWTVSFGSIITIVSLLTAVAVGYMNLIRRIDRIESKVEMMYDWFTDNVLNIRRKEHTGHTGRPAHRREEDSREE